MWALRELSRLLGRVVIGVALAIVIAGLKALIGGGDTFHTFRITLLLLGVLSMLLGAAPSTTLGGRKVTIMSSWMGWGRFDHVPGPRLTATAVFIASGIVLLVLGAAL